ncbi:MAG: hypothetical protein LBV16_08345 [Elusimicrobiota bacterium]|jgi:hypothetical protein|nr:hypothetical protein [Elusimicrobiota bacterium]
MNDEIETKNEVETNNDKKSISNLTLKNISRKDWIFLIAAVIYAISPIDLSGIDIPGVGYIDDGLFFGAAVLNIAQKFLGAQAPLLSEILKTVKWIFVVLAIATALLFLFLTLILLK